MCGRERARPCATQRPADPAAGLGPRRICEAHHFSTTQSLLCNCHYASNVCPHQLLQSLPAVTPTSMLSFSCAAACGTSACYDATHTRRPGGISRIAARIPMRMKIHHDAPSKLCPRVQVQAPICEMPPSRHLRIASSHADGLQAATQEEPRGCLE